MAPYEYTAAVEYLRRAKELAGYARFHDANNFASSAQKHSKDAKKVAQRRTKNNELPIFNPNDKSMYITRDGLVKRKSSLESDADYEKPPGLDNEKPPLINPEQDTRGKSKGGR